MKKVKESYNKGITLIALVVTIIVLLILAGISISMLMGENGILNRAKEAKEKTDEAVEKEMAGLEEIDWQVKDIMDGEDNEPVPEGMFYSIRNGEEKNYYKTFKEAYEASVDNGGTYRGGTIVLEKDATEVLDKTLEINKTITINLKLNTMVINNKINVMGGTLTITGQDSGTKIGTIRCNGNDSELFKMYKDANITVTGKPLLEASSHVICTRKTSVGR